ncbi:glycophorin-C [Manis javanica]|uniref:glycophorin-C n=1 Tax=Manis javanica TaxID=9974 RepID=UPI001879FECA|nr:glycophorin-C [Manis javanica]
MSAPNASAPTGPQPHLSTLPVLLTRSSPTTQPDLFTEPSPWVISTGTDIALIAGVVTTVAFVLLCLLFLTLHYMYRHKGTYHTNEAKGTEFAESADAALQDDPSLQDASGSSKEYFI